MGITIIKDKKGIEHAVRTEDGPQQPKEKDSYFRVPQKWWRQDLKGLSPTERCLIISLKVWNRITPSKSQLARELGIDRGTIIRTFKKLKAQGWTFQDMSTVANCNR